MKPSKLSYLKVWNRVVFYFAATSTGLLSLLSCQNNAKPSVIIIAVDRLGFNSFTCVDEKSSANSGLNQLCKEALRFTHAYTTSTQSVAAMTSLLTGKYPYEHKVHRNSDRLSSKQTLISEIANLKSYRTSFFSGSPAIMRKAGISKGFDVFDDISFLDKKNYLANFNDQAKNLLAWIQENNDPFLSVIYNSELELMSEGESNVSSFEKLDEKFSQFFAQLKDKNLWEKNYIVVIGLQGKSDYNRANETNLSNLHSENTNISLFVKPPRQKGDEGINWKIDMPVHLADLGLSLMRTLDESYFPAIEENFMVVDFSDLWKKSSTDFNSKFNIEANRKILIESINPWSEQNESRYAVLYKNLIYIESQSDELYNKINDGLETVDISNIASTTQTDFCNENRKILTEIRLKNNMHRWTNYEPEIDSWVIANREYWSKPNSRSAILEQELIRLLKTRSIQPLSCLLPQNLTPTTKLSLLSPFLKNPFIFQKPSAERESFYDEARRQSLNLALENLWGLWNKDKNCLQSVFTKENQ